jgi:hypothetical protein
MIVWWALLTTARLLLLIMLLRNRETEPTRPTSSLHKIPPGRPLIWPMDACIHCFDCPRYAVGYPKCPARVSSNTFGRQRICNIPPNIPDVQYRTAWCRSSWRPRYTIRQSEYAGRWMFHSFEAYAAYKIPPNSPPLSCRNVKRQWSNWCRYATRCPNHSARYIAHSIRSLADTFEGYAEVFKGSWIKGCVGRSRSFMRLEDDQLDSYVANDARLRFRRWSEIENWRHGR